MKTKIAVFFGGRSPEHDVSVITALQAMDALDSAKYEVIPVYLTLKGEWLTGAPLRQRSSYIATPTTRGVTMVRLDMVPHQRPRLFADKVGFMGKANVFEFDVALLAFHGLVGEDGGIQGLMETANVPYTGMRLMASALMMDKVATKHMLVGAGIPVLPFAEIRRPAEGTFIAPATIKKMLNNIKPPYCVKPSHLGSSIGVGKADDAEGVSAQLTNIFVYDNAAIVEPFVQNMVEYNVAVASIGNTTVTSAIEMPKRVSELLDFKEKYMSGGGQKTGSKSPSSSSEGMLSLTRTINPTLPAKTEKNIRTWAAATFDRVFGSGAPRIDFISNEKTGEVWLNEVNPMPGSFGYFLWEASKDNHTLFSNLLDNLIAEAVLCHEGKQLPVDPVPEAARLLKR